MPDGSARLVVETMDAPPEPDAAIGSVLRANQPAILDSSLAHPAHGRYSILACNPAETIICPNPPGTDPFAMLDEAIARTPRISGTLPVHKDVPFCGGWIGFLGYEAGRWLERLPARTGHHRFLPTAWFALYDTAAVYDRIRKQWLLVGVDWPRGCHLGRRPPAKTRMQKLQATLCNSVARNGQEYSQTALRAWPDFSRRQYEHAVARAIEYIAAGDIFQVNLSQRLVVATEQDPTDLFLRLRRHNPSFFGAYLRPPGAAIVSASPELFLSLRGRDVVTRPIKGTRRRAADPGEDARLRDELWQSPKDRAELAMIIDLERNDLGRVCEYGSIRVVEAAAMECHPTVHHLVATVAGRLREGLNAIDLLRATFPGGSITGAPKIRAMEIIDELEPVPRGVYCGSIGYVALDGSAMFNIAIRTIAIGAGEAEVYAGGGIVADSTPGGEYDETLAKAAALLDALGARLDDAERIAHAAANVR